MPTSDYDISLVKAVTRDELKERADIKRRDDEATIDPRIDWTFIESEMIAAADTGMYYVDIMQSRIITGTADPLAVQRTLKARLTTLGIIVGLDSGPPVTFRFSWD